MTQLTRKRCFNHSQREAAAKCMECDSFFCRECITEHDTKIYCASCHGALFTGDSTQAPKWRNTLSMILSFCFALLVLWMAFYLVGLSLAQIPADFHSTGMFRD
jgi:uncharacterized paraquat-inducible protein A